MFAVTRRMKPARSPRSRRAGPWKPRLAGLEDRTVPSRFMDGFEAPTLNQFWATSIQSGSVTHPSTVQVHTGNQSVQLNSTQTTQNKWIYLYHTFAQPT